MKFGRNEPCWCGSHKKYKQCHLSFDEKLIILERSNKEIPTREMIKNEEQIRLIKESAAINTAVLNQVEKQIRVGMTTEEINQIVSDFTLSKEAVCAPFGYQGYPKSVCTSINDQICHGIPDESIILKEGDIVNVDVSTIYHGYYSDASRMFCIGKVSEEAQKLVDVTKECLDLGIKAVKPWGHLGDIGAAIEEHARIHGYSVVEEFVGHGVGIEFHEDPMVPHYGVKDTGIILVPGMIFTIEPMINQGKADLFIDSKNKWTAYTKDGSLSAQWEHMILVTEYGVEILSY